MNATKLHARYNNSHQIGDFACINFCWEKKIESPVNLPSLSLKHDQSKLSIATVL